MSNYPLSDLTKNAFSSTDYLLSDDAGIPSAMVRIPKFLISDVIPGGSDTVHPAFIVNGQEVDDIYISKYQNVVHDGRAYSIPLEDPCVNIDFDGALAACAAKGSGWHLMTRAEWGLLALWCRINGCMPKGNNGYGKDHTESEYEAIPATYDGATVNRVLTGSGPLSWSHDRKQSGIFDLNGNVSEWLGGYRVMNGEIQVLANNNAADDGNSQAEDSTAWMAVLQDGSLVSPGTENTLKLSYVSLPSGGGSASFVIDTGEINQQADASDGYGLVSFSDLEAAPGVSVPEIIKALTLYPLESGDYGVDNVYMRNIDERMCIAGGRWNNGTSAGVFYLSNYYQRTSLSSTIGFRCAYVNMPA